MKSNNNLTVAMDIDGTLIQLTGEKEDTPRYDVISMFHSFERLGFTMFCWSGGGIDYCEMWVRKLGLNAQVVAKGSFIPDIAFDDQEVTLGKLNIRV